jgi:signal transduction histidine kinase
MNHRAEMIGGSLDIRRGDEGGTVVTCVFPKKKH